MFSLHTMCRKSLNFLLEEIVYSSNALPLTNEMWTLCVYVKLCKFLLNTRCAYTLILLLSFQVPNTVFIIARLLYTTQSRNLSTSLKLNVLHTEKWGITNNCRLPYLGSASAAHSFVTKPSTFGFTAHYRWYHKRRMYSGIRESIMS